MGIMAKNESNWKSKLKYYKWFQKLEKLNFL